MAIISQRNQSDTRTVAEIVQQLRSIAVQSLARMYRPEERLFAFRLRRSGEGEILDGVSRRYTAVVLIGLAGEDQHITAKVLGNHRPEDVCERLLDDIEESQELGETALAMWAARMYQHPRVRRAADRLRRMNLASGEYTTIELSWALTALVIGESRATDMALAERIAETLIVSFKEESGLFPHAPTKKGLLTFRGHVCCFADLVYPIQALSHYYQATRDSRAAEVAISCAERICELQGPEGQWWWYYDVRTGRVVERYPVYAVHQDSMAPMALFALAEVCGRDHSESIEKGLRWLFNPAETTGSLVDMERNVIWRRVGRREPGRLVRVLQAIASGLHPAIRLPAIDVVFPPTAVDYESRPYHMGWILHAWPTDRDLQV